ncbi:Hypothetical_protein [Hexamita inflata]|uniref:Hypothetical_protein n=1 Tax=Hexamita inflata TaxID=28002 RepID=A0AA86RE13_9EUKA|nr:Hypothetical protein HINF_LOCUS59052 [Hexamita inflata]CAI9972336.1 Hypothetical protein HINF_LOCUS59981 [Hexamita inflata]
MQQLQHSEHLKRIKALQNDIQSKITKTDSLNQQQQQARQILDFNLRESDNMYDKLINESQRVMDKVKPTTKQLREQEMKRILYTKSACDEYDKLFKPQYQRGGPRMGRDESDLLQPQKKTKSNTSAAQHETNFIYTKKPRPYSRVQQNEIDYEYLDVIEHGCSSYFDSSDLPLLQTFSEIMRPKTPPQIPVDLEGEVQIRKSQLRIDLEKSQTLRQNQKLVKTAQKMKEFFKLGGFAVELQIKTAKVEKLSKSDFERYKEDLIYEQHTLQGIIGLGSYGIPDFKDRQ